MTRPLNILWGEAGGSFVQGVKTLFLFKGTKSFSGFDKSLVKHRGVLWTVLCGDAVRCSPSHQY